MSDYIERDLAINELVEVYSTLPSETMYAAGRCIGAIDNIPAADVAPVIHAHWIRTNSGKWRCSRCRGRHDRPKRYCGECGARMNERMNSDG